CYRLCSSRYHAGTVQVSGAGNKPETSLEPAIKPETRASSLISSLTLPKGAPIQRPRTGNSTKQVQENEMWEAQHKGPIEQDCLSLKTSRKQSRPKKRSEKTRP